MMADIEHHHGRSNAEAYQVTERVKLGTDVAVGFEQASAGSIAEIEDGGGTYGDCTPLPPIEAGYAIHSSDGKDDGNAAAEEVEAGDTIGYLSDDAFHNLGLSGGPGRHLSVLDANCGSTSGRSRPT